MRILDFNRKLLTYDYKNWLEDYVSEKEVFPKIIELDPTTSCMFMCPDCINSELINRNKSFTNGELDILIRELAECGVLGIIFIGGGEPLMHPWFGEAIKLCKQLDIKVGITTNGLLIDNYLDEIAEIADWTRVSMDASTKETFYKARPNNIRNSFNRILSNIEHLNKIKRGYVGYSFLLLETESSCNIDELYDAAYLSKKLGCDYFEYKPMVDQHHYLYQYSNDFLEKYYQIVTNLEELNSESFHVIHAMSMEQYFKPELVQPKDYAICPVNDLRTVITPYGTYPCPYKRGYEEFNYGLAQSGFKKMWQDRKTALDASKDCSFYCIRHELNLELEFLKRQPEELKLINYKKTQDVFV